MIYPMVPFPVSLSDSRFQGHGVIFRPIDFLNVSCAQLTRDLFAIAKCLFDYKSTFFSQIDKYLKTGDTHKHGEYIVQSANS